MMMSDPRGIRIIYLYTPKNRRKKMETLNSKVLDMLKTECSCASKVKAYMNHVVVDLDNMDLDSNIDELQDEITALVEEHFPVREEILPFTINISGESRLEFTIKKSLVLV